MSAVTRLGDLTTGHVPFPPTPSIAASADVFVNGLGVVRVGDAYQSHCSGSCHVGVLQTGSPTVFVNGLPIGRVGDPVSCGDFVGMGSMNVFAG